MKKILKITILILVIISIAIITFAYVIPQIILHPNCFFSGGRWAHFSTPCSTDECKWIDNPAEMCAQVIAEGCECGPNMCWNGEKCISNP